VYLAKLARRRTRIPTMMHYYKIIPVFMSNGNEDAEESNRPHDEDEHELPVYPDLCKARTFTSSTDDGDNNGGRLPRHSHHGLIEARDGARTDGSLNTGETPFESEQSNMPHNGGEHKLARETPFESEQSNKPHDEDEHEQAGRTPSEDEQSNRPHDEDEHELSVYPDLCKAHTLPLIIYTGRRLASW
jgi:hypothetical protein